MFSKVIFHRCLAENETSAHTPRASTFGRRRRVFSSWFPLRFPRFLLPFALATATLPAAQDTRSAGSVYERVIPLNGADAKELTLFVKLPPKATRGTDVDGVFAFCTWDSDAGHIRDVLNEKPSDKPGGIGMQIMKYAAKHNLAVVSWTTFASKKTFDKTRSFDEMSRREAAKFDRAFDRMARTWRRGIDDMIKAYQLPKNKWLLYGMSRGGQWAHRIALREPSLFAAVHVHINSSYDQPTPDGNLVRWLVTTGELEAGYPAAKRFYAAAIANKYNMIFHAEPKLGHENHPNIDRLSSAFFDYNIAELRAAAAGRPPSPEERFVGNYFTHEYVPWSRGAEVPEMFRVALPNRKLAEAWGIPAEEP